MNIKIDKGIQLSDINLIYQGITEEFSNCKFFEWNETCSHQKLHEVIDKQNEFDTNEYVAAIIYNIGNDASRSKNYKFALECYIVSLGFYIEQSTLNNAANHYKLIREIDLAIFHYIILIRNFPKYLAGYIRLIKILLAENIMYDPYLNISPLGYLKQFFEEGGTRMLLDEFILKSTPEDAFNLKSNFDGYTENDFIF